MAQTREHADNHNTSGDFISKDCWGSDIKINAESVREQLLDIKNKIAPCKPRIIGVTKYYGLESIIKGYEAGLRDFGESRAVEAIKKIESLSTDIKQNSNFHFIGHLQTNKVAKVLRVFDYIHSIDSLKLAKAISEELHKIGRPVKLLIQVNNAGEEQKSGFSKEDLISDMPEILKLENLEIIGLMNIAPLGVGKEELKMLFKDIVNFRNELERKFDIKLPELSMGMSDDYEIAVQEGATMIRIGRKLFTK